MEKEGTEEKRIIRFAQMVLTGDTQERSDKARLLTLLNKEKADLDGVITLCKEIAIRNWDFEREWEGIAAMVAITVQMERDRFGELFDKATAPFNPRLQIRSVERAFTLGSVMGLLSGTLECLVETGVSLDSKFDASPLFRGLHKLVFMEYDEEEHLSSPITPGPTFDKKYEDRLSKVIKKLINCAGRHISTIQQEFWPACQKRREEKAISRLGELIVGQCAYALFALKPLKEKIGLATVAQFYPPLVAPGDHLMKRANGGFQLLAPVEGTENLVKAEGVLGKCSIEGLADFLAGFYGLQWKCVVHDGKETTAVIFTRRY
jgi:hypothetical protein